VVETPRENQAGDHETGWTPISGRYVVIPTTAADGRTHITYTPADQARLEQSLSHLVHALT